jgi:hypothetical protein
MLAAPESLRDWLRLKIFDAGVASGKYELANVAITPMVASRPWMRSMPNGPDNDGETAEMNETDAAYTVGDDGAVQVAAPAAYSVNEALKTDAQKFVFGMKLAEMDEHLGRIDLAAEDLRAAMALTKDAAQKKTLSGRVAALQAISARDAKNAERRPVIKDELLQSVVVRPRPTAQTPAQTSVRSEP